MLGNPLKYIDPSGHGVDCGIGMGCVSQPPTPQPPANPAPQPIDLTPDGFDLAAAIAETAFVLNQRNTFVIPNTVGGKLNYYVVPSTRGLRSVLGKSMGLLGFGFSVLPNLYDNHYTGASAGKTISDFGIDSGGFVVGTAGTIVGVGFAQALLIEVGIVGAPGTGGLSLLLPVASGLVIGTASLATYDHYVNQYNLRGEAALSIDATTQLLPPQLAETFGSSNNYGMPAAPVPMPPQFQPRATPAFVRATPTPR